MLLVVTFPPDIFGNSYRNVCWKRKRPNSAVASWLARSTLERWNRVLALGPFLERPGNLPVPETDFDIKVSRTVRCFLTSDEVHFVSLVDNFTVQFSNLLKLPLEWKTTQLNRSRNYRELRETGPWPGTLSCVLGQDTSLSQCHSPPRCINGYQRILRNFTEGNSRNLIKIFLFFFSPQWQLRHQNSNSPRSLCGHVRIFEPRGFVDERLGYGGLIKIHTRPFLPNRFLYVFF